tara:strand:- start:36 stop:650 length:615 start_codon:yes stop_codon:yes gene_type:complete
VKAINSYIVKPVGKRYRNSIDIDGKELIVNSSIEDHKYVNRFAEIISLPAFGETELEVGDKILVHHNVFRRWYDVKGREKNSKSYFEDNKYFVQQDQIYAYSRIAKWSRFKEATWKPLEGYCFVQPFVEELSMNRKVEHPNKGVVVYGNKHFKKGDVVSYTPFSQYEFVLEGKRLFRVHNKFITIKYEYKGDEEVYNPSWAQSS